MHVIQFVAGMRRAAPNRIGGVQVLGHRAQGGRWLAYETALHELRLARRIAAERRADVKVARADIALLSASRDPARATEDELAAAREELREREADAREAVAEVRARRARVDAARAALPSPSEPGPLEKLRAEHDEVVEKWMRYETDPALQIAYPEMTQADQPLTFAYLRAASEADERRPSTARGVTVDEFAAYRDAVAVLRRAFARAERASKAHAVEVQRTTPAVASPSVWRELGRRATSIFTARSESRR